MTALNENVRAIALVALARLRAAASNSTSLSGTGGADLDIIYKGSAAPRSIPIDIASHAMVAEQAPGWVGTHRLSIHAPLVVFDLMWNDNEPIRVLGYSRGEWERALVPAIDPNGSLWRREQGLKDALLREMLRERGLEQVPVFGNQTPEITETKRQTYAFGDRRTGPVAKRKSHAQDPAAMAAAIKEFGKAAGADLVGITRLQPNMIDLEIDCPYEYVICILKHEQYHRVLEGPRGVEEETYDVYYHCARIATEIADYVRSLGWDALPHHNGGTYVQAIPAMYQAGFGELGKHGSLINPEFGARFRPGFVTTSLPMAVDAPLEFGVQDYCLKCNLCSNNCPGEAIPTEFITTDGHRRWLTDMEKCYPYSRLEPDYCHICVDVCPYIHKENRLAEIADETTGKTKGIYKEYMGARRRAGWRTSKGALKTADAK
jgi:ferredoxin